MPFTIQRGKGEGPQLARVKVWFQSPQTATPRLRKGYRHPAGQRPDGVVSIVSNNDTHCETRR
jgi:hypothetical protein